MVRRTKADAQVTRHALLDAAEQLFQAHGVSRTSLNDIATAAGTTRGAIYWHFQDKADLFNAMMERVTLPLEESMASAACQARRQDDPLGSLRASLTNALQKTAQDEQTRRVFEVATHKVEYVEEMRAVRDRHLRVRNAHMAFAAQMLGEASIRAALRLPVPAAQAAMGLHVMVDGLIQNWLLDPTAFDLETVGAQAITTYLSGLGFTAPDAAAPPRAASAPSMATADATPPAPADSPTPERSRTRTA